MKKITIVVFFISIMAFAGPRSYTQMYRAAATEALENNGNQWIEKKLPSSVIIFSDYSGLVEIKTMIAALAETADSSAAGVADFTMNLDKSQLPVQLAAAKNLTTTGTLTLNNISKKIAAQNTLEPRNSGEGYTISVMIRFNPADFNLAIKDEPANEPLIVKVSNAYLNKQVNNF